MNYSILMDIGSGFLKAPSICSAFDIPNALNVNNGLG
jgi:hypothetical protein